MGANNFRELEIWQLGMQLVEGVYRLVQSFPPEERFALSDQLRRAVVSIPSNIAEGFGRETHRDFARFLIQARGSLYEVDTQIEIARRLGYCQEEQELMKLMQRTSSALGSFIRYLSTRTETHQAPSTRHPAP